jgi:hypothetical protein
MEIRVKEGISWRQMALAWICKGFSVSFMDTHTPLHYLISSKNTLTHYALDGASPGGESSIIQGTVHMKTTMRQRKI